MTKNLELSKRYDPIILVNYNIVLSIGKPEDQSDSHLIQKWDRTYEAIWVPRDEG